MPCNLHLVCLVGMPSNLHFSNTDFRILAGRSCIVLQRLGMVVPGRQGNPSYFVYVPQYIGKAHYLHQAIHK